MPRTINESVTQLKTSLSEVKTSLSNKNVEGGGQIKVSDIPGLIDQIETGGGGTEIDVSQFYCNSSIIVIFTDVLDGGLNQVKINSSVLTSNYYQTIYVPGSRDRGAVVAIWPDSSYKDQVAIELRFESDGDDTYVNVSNLDLSSPKLICSSGKH